MHLKQPLSQVQALYLVYVCIDCVKHFEYSSFFLSMQCYTVGEKSKGFKVLK